MGSFPLELSPLPSGALIGSITEESEVGANVAGDWVTTMTSTAWPTTNQAFYWPIIIQEPITVIQLAWFNGATASGNVDCGVYDLAGNRQISTGLVGQSGTTTLQVTDVADTALQPGHYYIAMNATTTSTFIASGTPAAAGLVHRSWGMYTQAVGAVTLPNPATFAAPAAAFLAACYIVRRTVF